MSGTSRHSSKKKGFPYTDDERDAIAELRVILGEHCEHETDDDLYKWLKAKRFNVNKAKNMYIKSLKFKRKYHADKIVEEYKPPEALQKYFAGGVCGFDKEGSPVSYELLSRLDWRGLLQSARKSEFIKLRIWQNEKFKLLFKEQTEKLGRVVNTIVTIVDCSGADSRCLWRPGLEIYIHLVNLLEDLYPGCVRKIYAINLPKIFPIMWKLGRPLIREEIRRKETILSGNYREHLLDVINEDQLPKCYGGTMTDPDGDPCCSSKICQGGLVPSKYFLTQEISGKVLENLEEIWIEPSRYLSVECSVQVVGSLIRWEFHTKDYDIGFGVLKRSKRPGEKDEQVVPLQRVNCQCCVEDGFHICETKGTYVVVFDNSYSWSRWKLLKYCVELLSTDQSNEDDIKELMSFKNRPKDHFSRRKRLSLSRQSIHLNFDQLERESELKANGRFGHRSTPSSLSEESNCESSFGKSSKSSPAEERSKEIVCDLTTSGINLVIGKDGSEECGNAGSARKADKSPHKYFETQ